MCLKKEGEYIKNIFLIYTLYILPLWRIYMNNYIYMIRSEKLNNYFPKILN